MHARSGVIARRCGRALLISAVLAACGSPEDASELPAVSRSEFLGALRRVEVSIEPRLTIGLDEANPDEALVGVRWAVLSGDSLLIIGDSEARRIGAFSLDGTLRRFIGRVGEGPGEFQSPMHGGLTDSGDIWVFDPADMRVLVYRPDGEPLATVNLRGDPSETSVLGVDGSGAVWVRTVSHFWGFGARDQPSIRAHLPGERYRTEVSVFRIVDGSRELVWRGEGGEFVFQVTAAGGVGGSSSNLAPKLLTTLLDGALVMTRTDSSSIERVRAGEEPAPWVDYPVARNPAAGRYLNVAGPNRYDVLTESYRFVEGIPGSVWLILRNAYRPHPILRLNSDGPVEHIDPGDATYNTLFVGENALVGLSYSGLGVQSVSVYGLKRH